MWMKKLFVHQKYVLLDQRQCPSVQIKAHMTQKKNNEERNTNNKNLSHCFHGHKIETGFTIAMYGKCIFKGKKSRFTQNRKPHSVLPLFVFRSGIPRLGNKWTALNCRLSCFYVPAFLSKWGLNRVVSCGYGRNTHVHVMPELKETVRILQDIKNTAMCKLENVKRLP